MGKTFVVKYLKLFLVSCLWMWTVIAYFFVNLGSQPHLSQMIEINVNQLLNILM